LPVAETICFGLFGAAVGVCVIWNAMVYRQIQEIENAAENDLD
jgi:hypothetical protein